MFVVCIRKDRLCARYSYATNPYELAITFIMERVVFWMEHNGQTSLPILAEARGKKEDNSLKATFFDLMNNGTDYVSVDRFRGVHFVFIS